MTYYIGSNKSIIMINEHILFHFYLQINNCTKNDILYWKQNVQRVLLITQQMTSLPYLLYSLLYYLHILKNTVV